MSFSARATIRVGTRQYTLIGSGAITDPQGIVRGTYRHDLPANDFQPFVLQVVLVTGYPSICRSTPEQNPFKHGDYHYRRHVAFNGHGELEYEARCWSEDLPGSGRRLCSEFDVNADLNLPPIAPATRVREVWAPRGAEISSVFEIAWPLRDGTGEVHGSARSLYSPHRHAPLLDETVRRSIAFSDVTAADGVLSLVQESWLEN